MNRIWMKVISSFTVFIFAATAVFGEGAAAMMYPTGVVMLNGNAVPGATTLFNGDVVSTAGGMASFTTPKSRISVTAQTTVKMDGHLVDLRAGAVTVDTQDAFPTQAAQFKIVPSEGTARYRVIRKDETVLVASLEGPVLVRWGTQTHMIPSGATWGSPEGGGQQPEPTGRMPKSDKDKGLGTGTLILIGAGMAGLATGLALSVSTNHPVSPVRP